MAFAIYSQDKPAHQHVRDEHRAAHYAYLEQHSALLIASGGLQDDAGQTMIGSVIILDVETREEASRFVDGDPFTRAGLAERVEIVRWKKAFFDGKRVTA